MGSLLYYQLRFRHGRGQEEAQCAVIDVSGHVGRWAGEGAAHGALVAAQGNHKLEVFFGYAEFLHPDLVAGFGSIFARLKQVNRNAQVAAVHPVVVAERFFVNGVGEQHAVEKYIIQVKVAGFGRLLEVYQQKIAAGQNGMRQQREAVDGRHPAQWGVGSVVGILMKDAELVGGAWGARKILRQHIMPRTFLRKQPLLTASRNTHDGILNRGWWLVEKIAAAFGENYPMRAVLIGDHAFDHQAGVAAVKVEFNLFAARKEGRQRKQKKGDM